MTNGEVIQNGNMFEDDISKGFFSDVLHRVCNLSLSSNNQKAAATDIYLTSRDIYHGTREDLSTESGVALSDDSALFVEARPSPLDLNKQKEVVEVLTRFLQVCLSVYVSVWLYVWLCAGVCVCLFVVFVHIVEWVHGAWVCMCGCVPVSVLVCAVCMCVCLTICVIVCVSGCVYLSVWIKLFLQFCACLFLHVCKSTLKAYMKYMIYSCVAACSCMWGCVYGCVSVYMCLYLRLWVCSFLC